jgi:glutamine synthetase
VDRWQGLMRAAIAHAGNDHRLGANEAPPAIISVFLGDMLTDVFEQIENGGAKSTKKGGILETGVAVLPQLPRDAGDRNRTSPFAFTGNKFEFRAVGSSQNIAWPNVMLNLAAADALESVADALEKAVAGGRKLEDAVLALVKDLVAEHKRIIFNGNNYSQEWQDEAKRRGLLNHRNTVDALGELVGQKAVAAFARHGILNEREMRARYEVALEAYNKSINIEGQTMVLMANRYILPAAVEYQKRLAESVSAVKGAGSTCTELKTLLDRFCDLTCELRRRTDALAHELDHSADGTAEAHAKHFRDKVVPAMAALREAGDRIEQLVPHELWPLPTYREMLFTH